MCHASKPPAFPPPPILRELSLAIPADVREKAVSDKWSTGALRSKSPMGYIPTFFRAGDESPTREAVFVDWRDLSAWLGRPYRADDKTALIELLLSAPGHVSFVRDGETVSSEHGLYFLGPAATSWSWN